MPIPAAPIVTLVNLGVTANISGQVHKALAQFTWSNPDATAYYRAQLRTPAGGGAYVDYAVTALNAAAMTIWELTPNATYDFRFRGENGSGNSAWTDVLAQTTGTSTNSLTAPSACAASNITEATADITWTETEINEDRVFIYYRKEGASTYQVIQAGTFDRFITLVGLDPLTNYRVSVALRGRNAVHATIFSNQSPEFSFVTAAAPTTNIAVTGQKVVKLRKGVTVPPIRWTSTNVADVDWTLTVAPPGVTITEVAVYPATPTVELNGSPNDSGDFSAWLSAVKALTPPAVGELNIRFLVEGDYFLADFHEDPLRTDIQIDVGRKFNVHSVRAPDCPAVPLKLVRGDTFRWHIILRNGGATLKPSLQWLAFTLRLPGNYQAGALLNVEDTAPAAEQFGTHFAFPIAAVCTSAFIEQIFGHLDKTASDKAEKIVASAQVAWREGGRGFASRPFPVWIEQDENR